MLDFLYLLHDSFLVVVAQRAAQLVVVHGGAVLLHTPQSGHLRRTFWLTLRNSRLRFRETEFKKKFTFKLVKKKLHFKCQFSPRAYYIRLFFYKCLTIQCLKKKNEIALVYIMYQSFDYFFKKCFVPHFFLNVGSTARLPASMFVRWPSAPCL